MATPIWSQVTTATLYGIVTDASGAAVPGATATLLHQETNASTMRTADSRGEFAFDFLRVGTYDLQIEGAGFKKQDIRGMELGVGQTVRRTFMLEVGSVRETVTVDAQAPLVSTASSEQNSRSAGGM